MIVTYSNSRSAPARNTLDSPHVRANILSFGHGGRSRRAKMMRRPMNRSSASTKSMSSTRIAAVVTKDAAAMIRMVKPSLEPRLLPALKMSGGRKKNILNGTAKLGQTNSSSKRKQRQERKKEEGEKMEVPSTYWSIMSYISYIFLVMVGYFREMIWGIGPIGNSCELNT